MITSTIRALGLAGVTVAVLSVASCSANSPAATTNTSSPAAPTSGSAQSTSTATGNGVITSQGIGEVIGTPDVVTISLGVQTDASTASVALADNSTRAAAVIKVIKASGVADTDLHTSQLSINQTSDKDGKVTGFQVSNMVTAKLHSIFAAGPLIDAAGNAIRVQQLSFSIDDESTLIASASADAVKKAQTQAEQLAKAAGVTLGKIKSIIENPTADQNLGNKQFYAAAAFPAAAPIESGSQRLNVTFQVVYEISQ